MTFDPCLEYDPEAVAMESKMAASSGGEVATNGINGSFKPVEDQPVNHEYSSPPNDIQEDVNPGLTFDLELDLEAALSLYKCPRRTSWMGR